MDEKFERAVYLSLAEIFGTMFFTEIEPLDEFPEEERFGKPYDGVESIIDFEGKECGEVHFYFPKELASNIAANFMGIDESELDEDQMIDTVKECANMAVGCLLGKIDPKGECSLGIPTAETIEGFTPDQLDKFPDLFVFETEFGLLWVDCAEVEGYDSR